ncbi:MAG: hypothetical protein GX972_06170 [Amphibacillus sp.]|nr:hypothetical protein [Amphibacillus sp.]
MEKKTEDQAEALRQQLAEINQQNPTEESTEFFNKRNDQEIDILNLPPRSQIHQKDKFKLRMKMSGAFLRLITILIFVILILLLSFNYWKQYFF